MNLNQLIIRKQILVNSSFFLDNKEELYNKLDAINKDIATIKTNEFLCDMSEQEIYFLYRKIMHIPNKLEKVCKEIGLNPICKTYLQTIKHIIHGIAIEYLSQVN